MTTSGSQSQSPGGVPGASAMPKFAVSPEMLESLFNRELDEGSQERVLTSVLRDPALCRQLVETRRLTFLLRQPVPAPDLSKKILARVHRRRSFLSARAWRQVRLGRGVLAVGILAAVLALAATQRWMPEVGDLATAPPRVAPLIDTGSSAAASGAKEIAGAISAATASLAEPVLMLSDKLATFDGNAPRAAPAPRAYSFRVLTPGDLRGIRRLGPGDGVIRQPAPLSGSGRITVSAEDSASFDVQSFQSPTAQVVAAQRVAPLAGSAPSASIVRAEPSVAPSFSAPAPQAIVWCWGIPADCWARSLRAGGYVDINRLGSTSPVGVYNR